MSNRRKVRFKRPKIVHCSALGGPESLCGAKGKVSREARRINCDDCGREALRLVETLEERGL